MTEKLYYTDGYMKEFEATVMSCEPSGNMWKVVLDRTAFFPEGGGQAADIGTLGTGTVSDVQEKEDKIYHVVDEALEVGSKVCGKLDWETRFTRMQQHTGEHIVSGLIHSRFGYDNVGFHLSDNVCTLDLNGPITKEELKEIEYAANEKVAKNLEVYEEYPSKEELQTLVYRSKIEIEGQVRIIRIPECDVCACCAPHVRRTGEIGLIKFTDSQNYKGGVRITMACGFRALADYRLKEESVKAIMCMLSAKEENLAEAVEKLKAEQISLKSSLAETRHELLVQKAEQLPENEECVCLFEEKLTGNEPRELMNLTLDRGNRICAVFAGKEAEGFRYVIGSRTEDVRALCKELNEKFHGRGGGKPEMVQGSITGTREEVYTFFSCGKSLPEVE